MNDLNYYLLDHMLGYGFAESFWADALYRMPFQLTLCVIRIPEKNQ